MAPAVPLVAAAAGWATTTALGSGLLASIAGFVVSTAISQIGGRALSKKPKNQAFSAEASGRTTIVRSSIESHKIIYGEARVSGPLVYVATSDAALNSSNVVTSGDNRFLHMVIPLAGHEVEEIGTVYLNDTAVTLDASTGFAQNAPFVKDGLSYVRVIKKLGAADQAVDPTMGRECPGWTVDHRLRGIAYLYVRLEFNQDVFPLGIPNVSAIVKGKKVFDPRTDTTAWSDNAALCIRDYLATDYGFGCADDEINDTYFIAAANVSDESVTTTTGTQARYTCNGVVDTASAPLDNLGALVTALAGAVTYVQGQFRLHAGAYDAPSGTITTDMLAGDIDATFRTERKELFNAVKGTYVDPDKSWQPTDFPFVTNATYEEQDGGERIYKDVELPFTTDPEAAQRIAKLLLEKARQGIKATLTLNHSAMKYAAFDVINLTIPTFGWSAKPFRILKVTTDGMGPVTLAVQEESSASYDWNSGEATTIDPAPDTNLPNPLDVAAPGAPQVSEAKYVTTDGSGVKVKATVTWGASTDAFLREYQLEYKLTVDTDYTLLPRTSATAQEVLDITPGVYDFRVKAISTLGVSSPYANTTAEIYGLTDAPGDITGLSLNAIGGAAHLSWDQSVDLDVLNGGHVRIRYTPLISGATWNAAVDIGTALPGVATQATLPLLDGTYLAKFIDSTGNASVNAATIIATLTSLIEMNVVETLTEHPDFTGAKDGVVFDEALSGIKLAGATNWDSYPGNVDTWPMIDSLGGVASSGTYTFSEGIDLGAVYPCRLTAMIGASGYDVGDTIDARTANMDSWTSFDGGGLSDFASVFVIGSATNVTITADQAIAPDGTLTADRMRENSATGNHQIFGTESSLNIPANTITTIEMYVKPDGRNFQIQVNWLVGEEVRVSFDLVNGDVESTVVDPLAELIEAGIRPAANGFYKVWVTSRGLDLELSDARYGLLDASFNRNYAGDGTSGVYLWGYQIYRGLEREGSAIDDVNATLYLRTTNDDPAGTPEWGDWRPFFVGDYTARAFEFRLDLESDDPAHNMLITSLSATVDMPDRVEKEQNLTSGAGTYSATFPSAFKATPSIVITPKNMATGDYYTVSNESATGFDVVFRNAGGSAVSRNFDYHAKGYGRRVT